MHKIPFYLIFSRFFLGIVIVLLAFAVHAPVANWIVGIMFIGLLTDFFDGYLARKMHVSTEKLRIYDSNVDQFFWIATIVSIFYLNRVFVLQHWMWILNILVLEILCYLVSYIKFGKPIATHAILSKVWTLSLLIFLTDLCLNSESNIAFKICVLLGVISRIEILLIVLRLSKWTTDVPSILSVPNINKGIPIKKNIFFNH